ncbi:hypothetical protein [Piscinibacter sp.]|uniref:N-acyl amino acid synthase FeeM domain-containing protein n=2 Tax=Piscinibacter TaxID=1114981 RepID=UPI0035B0C993
MRTEQLSFDLRVAGTEEELADAREVRASAYGHHVPELLESMRRPDPADRLPGTVVLLARDCDTGLPIGTARITTNAHRPLQLERGYELPLALKGWHLAEITRLAVAPSGDDKLVKRALMKACYLVCLSMQVHKMVIGARSAALIRGYRSIGFECLTAETGPVELAHAGGLPHHILAFDVTSAERVWHSISHPLYAWMVRTFHPNINVSPIPIYEPTGASSRSPNTLGILDSLRRRSAEPVAGSAPTA